MDLAMISWIGPQKHRQEKKKKQIKGTTSNLKTPHQRKHSTD